MRSIQHAASRGGIFRRLFHRNSNRSRERQLSVEPLERRLVLTLPPCVAPACFEVPLTPQADQFGFQIDMVQAYEDADGTRATFSIFDTGASIVTFSAVDQLIFDLLNQSIPVKVPGGAHASGVGGAITGDVSQPGRILADGLHAWELDPNNLLDSGFNLQQAATADNVQAFIGTLTGSRMLPSIVGTPLLNPSPKYPDGAAAVIDLEAYPLDFGALFPELPEFKDIVVYLPDLRFTGPDPAIDLPLDGSVTDLMRVPVSMFGEDNHQNPGDDLTTSWSPVQTDVATYEGDHVVTDKTLLFDTGAQLSVISTEMALGLGLDLNAPDVEITVQGNAGQVDIIGFTIDALELPRDTNGDGNADGILRFTEVPIYVLDIGEGLDGILGMNLLNPAHTFAYDPFSATGPAVSIAFETSRVPPGNGGGGENALRYLGNLFPQLAATQQNVRLPGSAGQTSWHNGRRPSDIDNDGHVVPIDALLVINELNAGGSRSLSNPPIRSRPVQTYLDVNGDTRLTPIDVLLVINELNNGSGGEAEASDSALASSTAPIVAFANAGPVNSIALSAWHNVATPIAVEANAKVSVPSANAMALSTAWLDLMYVAQPEDPTSASHELEVQHADPAAHDAALDTLVQDTLAETLIEDVGPLF